MSIPIDRDHWRQGAIYLLGSRRGWGRAQIVALLVERCRLNSVKAEQLAGHWLRSDAWHARRVAA